MRVEQAWKLGYSGKGIVVTILDDGIQKDHPDLAKNYVNFCPSLWIDTNLINYNYQQDPMASADINDHDDNPTPRTVGSNE